MPTVFDVITSKSISTGAMSLCEIMKLILNTTDFADRHGKQVYANWLKSSTAWASYRDPEYRADDLLPIIASSTMEASRLIEFARDCLIRDLHLALVVDIVMISLRDNVSTTSGDGDYSTTSNTLDEVCVLLDILLKKMKSLSEGPEGGRLENVMSFALLKLSIARQVYKPESIDRVISAMIEAGMINHISRYMGMGYARIVQSLCVKFCRTEALCITKGRIDEELVSRKVMRFFKLETCSKTIARSKRVYSETIIASFKPSAFDISLVLNLLLCDSLKGNVVVILKHVSGRTRNWSPFESLVIHMAFWNNILSTANESSTIAIESLLTCLVDKELNGIAKETLRYIALQTAQMDDKEEWRRKINLAIKSSISSARLNENEIKSYLQSISPFYEIIITPNPSSDIEQVEQKHRPAHVGDTTCLNALMEMIKKSKLVGNSN